MRMAQVLPMAKKLTLHVLRMKMARSKAKEVLTNGNGTTGILQVVIVLLVQAAQVAAAVMLHPTAHRMKASWNTPSPITL